MATFIWWFLLGTLFAFSPSAARPDTNSEEAQVSRILFELHTNKTLVFIADIGSLVKIAQKRGHAVQMDRKCSEPIKIEVSKCGTGALKSAIARNQDKVVLQDSWLPFLAAKCDSRDSRNSRAFNHNSVSIKVFATVNTSCQFVFELVRKIQNVEQIGKQVKFRVDLEKASFKRYKTNIENDEYSTTQGISLKHDLPQYVVFFMGKCGLMSPDRINWEFTDQDFAKLTRFRQMACDEDDTFGFDTYLSSLVPATGQFYYELSNEKTISGLSLSTFYFFSLVTLAIVVTSSLCSQCLYSDGLSDDDEFEEDNETDIDFQGHAELTVMCSQQDEEE